MDYIHVKNLEKYHPGYKDRNLKWFKCYFKMVNADPEFEMLCEVDKWRFVALIMLELQYQKPIPLDDNYFKRKGFGLKKRPMSLTLQMLQGSVEVVTSGQPFETPDDMGCIYFLESENSSIKIGHSKHLGNRIKDLKRHGGQNIRFIYAHKGTIQLENTYHDKFAEHQIAPEWYTPHQTILDFMDELRQNPDIKDVTEDFDVRNAGVTQIREDKNRKDKNKIENALVIFSPAIRIYPGTKRKLSTEYDNFKKKHADYKEAVSLLEPAILKQIAWRKNVKDGEFRPAWKHFSTWINNRCWEDEVAIGSKGVTRSDVEAYEKTMPNMGGDNEPD